MTILDKFNAAHETWDKVRHAIILRLDHSGASAEALNRLLIESGAISELMEQWGDRLETALDEYNLDRIAANADKQVRGHHG